ncbi:MAG: GTPase domain-containing protein [Cyanobacteria bacterium REEB67]|nr:GTPase domain-containing protein [Cyanobacteria bacterium REEB67]
MALVNYGTKEITFKLVYYGTGLGGKTTNLKIIHSQLAPQTRGELVSLATETERTLFFDFMPLDLGTINGFKARISMYTVPGQEEYNKSRKLILRDVDGIVFVADSNVTRSDENQISLNNMMENLNEYRLTLTDIPWVLQYNKRDLTTAMTIERMESELNKLNVPAYEAVAMDGKGVFATLKAVTKMMLQRAKGND